MEVEVREIFNDYKVKKPSSTFRRSTMKEIFNMGRRGRRDSLISMSQYQAEPKNLIKEKAASRLPAECMRLIIKHVERKRDIVSCLLVNKHWCSTVIPLLWARPFDNVSLENRFKLIRTYISCLEGEERSGLNYALRKYRVEIPYSSQVLFEYATYLERFSYNKLYMAVDSGIRKYISEVAGRSTHQQTILITSVLCQLFMRQSRRVSSIEITKFYGAMDLPRSSLFSAAEYALSSLQRLELEYTGKMTRNTLKLLKYISKYCHKILIMELRFPYLTDKMDVVNSIVDIINAQTQLTEFRLSGLRFGAEKIVPALVSQADSLSTLKFMNCDFTGTDFGPLANCK
ncbi:14909_t:CDS:1, partial [Acaulospora colombiana]